MNHTTPTTPARALRTGFAFKTPALALGGLVLALTAALWLTPTRLAAQAPTEASAPKPALTVVAETPTTVNWRQTLSANGSVAPWQELSAGAEAQGLRLTELRAQVGDRVKAGQVLAVFDDQAVRAEVQQARAALSETKATAAEALANAERARSLQASGALSAQQIAQYTTAAATAQARVESAQAALTVQELRLKHTQVLAPDAGTVIARSATVGAVVPAGTELFRLIRQGRLEWRGEVAAADLPRLRPGMAVQLKAAGGATAQGKVRTLAPAVDAQTRTALVYVDLAPSTSDAIRAGMFATGSLALGEQPATTVPQSALVSRDGFQYLFVLGEGDTPRVQQLKVQTGQRQGDRVALTDGLPTGTPRVVVKGAGFLNDGDTVKVVSAQQK